MYLASVFLDNYGGVEIASVKEALQICNEVFICTYHGNDCVEKCFDDINGKKKINYHGEEFVDFWDTYKDYHDECTDMNNLPVVVAARKVMEIRGKI